MMMEQYWLAQTSYQVNPKCFQKVAMHGFFSITDLMEISTE